MKRLMLVFFLLITFGLFANNLTVDFSITQGLFNVFLPSYIDPNNLENQPIFFSCTISNNTTQTIDSYSVYAELSWNGVDLIRYGDVVAKSKNPLGEGNALTFTNQDIFTDGGNSLFSGDYDYDTILNNSQEFQDIVKETGRFPDGDYVFKFKTISEDDPDIAAEGQGAFTILSPFSLTLITPGIANTRTTAEINTMNPSFVWVSNLSSYNFYLYEVTSKNVTLETLKEERPLYSAVDIKSPSFAYPAEATQLKDNTIYAWRVEGEVKTPLDEQALYLYSDVNFFQLSLENEDNTYTQLTQLLEMIPGEELQALLNLLEAGYVPTGNFEIDGISVSSEELYSALSQVLNGSKTIQRIIVR